MYEKNVTKSVKESSGCNFVQEIDEYFSLLCWEELKVHKHRDYRILNTKYI